jgi:NAD(P)H-dependent FMN reductase
MNLTVIIASTRPGRLGGPIGTWIVDRAKSHGAFDEVVVADLKEIGLPFLDEPKHPRLREYVHEHTKRWSAIVDAADAFVLVTPEYNHALAPALVNALDFLFHEWAHKPAAFVSYGGISGGLRAVQMTKPMLMALKMMPMVESVVIPFAAAMVKDGVFTPNDTVDKSVGPMFDELRRWAGALATLR